MHGGGGDGSKSRKNHMERRDAQNGRDGAAAAQLRRHSSSFAVAVPSQQQFRRSNSSVAAAALSQQQLRRSSSSVASSAPSQQHQLRRGRDAQNERDGAGLRSSVAAATPSQLCRSSAARTMSAGAPPAGAPSHHHGIRRRPYQSVTHTSRPY